MSGHSKWHKVKHQKAARDPKRAKMIARHVKEIETAARKNSDPDANPELAKAIEKAKSDNVPKDNIESAIDRGAGRSGGSGEEFSYAAFTPEGVAFLIIGDTDNKNRTLGEIREALKRVNGTIAELKSVLWQFEKKETDEGITYEPKVTMDVEADTRANVEAVQSDLDEIPEITGVFTNIE